MYRPGLSLPFPCDFFLHVDELQSFATEEFPSILSEARKYRLCVIAVNQYISQLPDSISASLLGNAGSVVVFAIGATDANILEAEFRPTFIASDIQSLPWKSMYVKLSIRGITSEPLPMCANVDSIRRLRIIEQSRQRFCSTHAKIATSIEAWINQK